MPNSSLVSQPPSGGCVLKRPYLGKTTIFVYQPPSGGCVLKRYYESVVPVLKASAAFGRLCVETFFRAAITVPLVQPPSGGCVLKHQPQQGICQTWGSAAFGRLCVETCKCALRQAFKASAAFGRLCVETRLEKMDLVLSSSQPPSGGCVLKQVRQ